MRRPVEWDNVWDLNWAILRVIVRNAKRLVGGRAFTCQCIHVVRGWLVIKIVYRDLSPGLHASAQVSGRHTIISLLPGLTLHQRRAALRRIRHSGRMGHGPRVPAMGLALAVGRDRIKATARTGAAVVRLHPAGSTLPVVLLSAAAVVFVLMATVSIHVLPGPKSDQSPVIGGVTPGPASSGPQSSQGAAPPVAGPGHSA